MQAPRDYAEEERESVGAEAGDITYAALLDRHAAEQPITDEMIRRACLRMETAQTWPFAAAPERPRADERSRSAGSAGGTLARLLRLRRRTALG